MTATAATRLARLERLARTRVNQEGPALAGLRADRAAAFRLTAADCPRIPPDFLAEERRALGPRWLAQEYECDFTDAVDAVFSPADIQAALGADVPPLPGV